MPERDACLMLTVTPGRSGSVFLADVLRRSFDGPAEITHERLGPGDTLPRMFFNAVDEPRLEELAAFPPVARFLDHVEQRLAQGCSIIEVGMFSSHLIPLCAQRFGARVRVLGLFRHPLITAASHSLRGMYHPWPHWSYFHLANLTPFAPGARGVAFRDRWASMSPFERNLYWWMEYVLLWRDVRRSYPSLPHLLVHSEDLFAHPAQTCQMVAAFAGLEGTVKLEGMRKNAADLEGTLRFGLPPDWRDRIRMPELTECAREMGYDLDTPKVLAQLRRYEAPTSPAYRLLKRAGWYELAGYVRRLTRPRFWKYYGRYRRLKRTYPQYFTSPAL